MRRNWGIREKSIQWPVETCNYRWRRVNRTRFNNGFVASGTAARAALTRRPFDDEPNLLIPSSLVYTLFSEKRACCNFNFLRLFPASKSRSLRQMDVKYSWPRCICAISNEKSLSRLGFEREWSPRENILFQMTTWKLGVLFFFQVSFFFEESSLYSITPLLALLGWFLSPVSRKGKIRPNPNSFHAS